MKPFSLLFALSVVATVVLFAAVLARPLGRRFAAGFLALVSAWMAVTGGLAASGFLTDFSLPPRFLVVILPAFVGVFLLARREWARRIPWGVLIGLQGFRIGVELLIHAAVARDIAPPQMTWTGLNFDMLTGLTAPLVAWLATTGRLRERGIFAWNGMGALLLAHVVVVAILSTPTPFQVFHPDNTWVVGFPYVWLPAVFVAFAMWLHVLSFYKLALARNEAAPST